MKVLQSIVLLAVLGVFMSGCSSKYRVHVNGFLDTTRAQTITPGASILMVEEGEEEDSNPIFQSEVKQKVRMLLESQGYRIGTTDSADYQLFFRYGMDSGRTVRSTRLMHEPSQIVTVHRSNNKGGTSYSTIHIPGKTYSVPYSETIFGHWLTLYLYDASKAEDSSTPDKPIWIGEVSNYSPSSDLREMINPMLIAGFEHFGQNTHKRVTSVMKKTDERVTQLTGN